jgi:hypothetical protein
MFNRIAQTRPHVMRLCVIAVFSAVLVARAVRAQTAGATVSGIARDSVASAPLPGAIVQLVTRGTPAGAAVSATSDSLGRFQFSNVPDGRYLIGFFHPMLDSLGVLAPVHEILVQGTRDLHVDVGIPSAASLRAAICGASVSGQAAGMVVGFVRQARDHEAVAKATVVGEWVELSLTPHGTVRSTPSVVAATGANGWFALCHVPSSGIVAISAIHMADSTELVEVDMGSAGILHRELYFGSERGGRLTGTVISAAERQPIANALVSVGDGTTRTDERGDWTLTDVPLGTRMLEIRAINYYPERRAVDVVGDAPAVFVALGTLKAKLDAVKITAARLSLNTSGFDERRRGGDGYYITPEDVAQRNPMVTSEMLRRVPGLRLERGSNFGDGMRVLMRGTAGSACSPAVYIDGGYMGDLSADDLDDMVNPDQIAGIEVYAGAAVPPQFTRGMAGVGRTGESCGSIVIWTRPSSRPGTQLSLKQRALAVLGVAALTIAVLSLFHRR